MRRDLAGRRLDVRQVGAAVVALRRRHAEEGDVAVLDGVGRADDEAEASRSQALVDQPVEAVLDDRDLPGRQAGDLVGVDVGADDLVAEVGEAGSGGQPDVARPDDGDPRHAWKLLDGRSRDRLPDPRVSGGSVTTVTTMLLAPPPDDPGLVDACGLDPGAICEAVWDGTSNEVLTKLTAWVIGNPLTIILILLIAWIVARWARRLVRRAVNRLINADREAAKALRTVGLEVASTTVDDPRRAARASSISTVLSSTVTVLIWVIALFLVLGELGINLAPLIAGAGIAGVALGFGAQNLVKDCVSGLFMLIEDQYGIGDVVDLGEAIGAVERVTLRTTVLRGQDGTVWHVPNGEVRRVGNRSKLWSVAVLDVSVAYDADLDSTRQVLTETAAEVCGREDFASDVIAAPEVLGLESVSPEAMTLRLLVKTEPGAQFRLQRALREAIKLALDRAGVAAGPALRRPSVSLPSRARHAMMTPCATIGGGRGDRAARVLHATRRRVAVVVDPVPAGDDGAAAVGRRSGPAHPGSSPRRRRPSSVRSRPPSPAC